MEDLNKEQESLIDIFSEERGRRDREEESLRKKLKVIGHFSCTKRTLYFVIFLYSKYNNGQSPLQDASALAQELKEKLDRSKKNVYRKG